MQVHPGAVDPGENLRQQRLGARHAGFEYPQREVAGPGGDLVEPGQDRFDEVDTDLTLDGLVILADRAT